MDPDPGGPKTRGSGGSGIRIRNTAEDHAQKARSMLFKNKHNLPIWSSIFVAESQFPPIYSVIFFSFFFVRVPYGEKVEQLEEEI